MFEGVPDQFHQFIASRTSSLPLPLCFPPLHASSNTTTTTFPSFDPFNTSSSSHQQIPLQPNFLHPLHQGSSPPSKNDQEKEENSMVATMNLEIERERSIPEPVDPWSNEEVLALLRIRSSMENWFPEFTWEHVSRKLAELGFKRSGEKCKEKFEEESRYFNSINYNKNYRAFSDFEELYHGDHQNPPQDVAAEKNKKMDKTSEEEDKMGQNLEEDARIIEQTVGKPTEENGKEYTVEKSMRRKRNREKKYEMMKDFCEDIVNKIMAQQEEMHNKLLGDMVKRDEEKVAREEAWKKQEMERVNKELELRAQEQALAGDRQATIINFLRKFTSSTGSSSAEMFGESSSSAQDLTKVPNSSNPSTSSSLVLAQNPNPPTCQTSIQSKHEAPTSSTVALGPQDTNTLQAKNYPMTPISLTENQPSQNPSSTLVPNIPLVSASSTQALPPQNPNSLNPQNNPSSLPTYKVQTKSKSNDKDDLGKRWPRDEVLALINLRCSLYNSNEDKEGAAKTPLWERISQGMLELGYKRSAKRCKEKWENINKYFRKTKDINKKRSIDSRTCPYFHHLSTLYNQGILIAPSDGPENRSNSPKNHLALPETRINTTSSQNGSRNSTMHVPEGEKNMVQVPAFDFEF